MTFPHDPFDGTPRDPEMEERLARLSARSAERRTERSGPRPAAPTTDRRRSAAKGSRSAALGMSIVSTVGLAGYLYAAAHSGGAGAVVATAAGTDTATTVTTATTATTVATASGAASTTTSTSSSLANGTYTGTSVTTRYGPVQVQITVSGGQITAVTVPVYPSNDSKSRSINATAVPKLVQSTLTAQSASVSSVSGATYTTNAYKQSLQSAIDQARAAATSAR
jgi:uncharacterized protein with FMN-binding domain